MRPRQLFQLDYKPVNALDIYARILRKLLGLGKFSKLMYSTRLHLVLHDLLELPLTHAIISIPEHLHRCIN